MSSFASSSYHKYIDLQNVSGSGDPSAAPLGGVYLFASGTQGSAKLYLQNEGVSTPLDIAAGFDIDSYTELEEAPHATQDEFLVSDNGTEKRVSMTHVAEGVFALVTGGDATINSSGAVTIAAGAVEHGMLADDIISGQGELSQGDLVAADEFMVSDGGTIKRLGADNFATDLLALSSEAALDVAADYIVFLDGGASGDTKKEQLSDVVANMAGDGLAASSGVLAVQVGTNKGLALTSDKLEITGSAVAAEAVAVGTDTFMFFDADGSVKEESFADLATAQAGDGLVASSGVLAVQVDDSGIEINSDTLRLKDNGVTLAKMAGITRGSVIVGDASGDPSLLAKGSSGQFLQSDGTDPSYVTMSGDVASLASGGAVTLAAAQTNITSILATDLKIGEDDQTKIDFETADEIHFYAANAEQVYVADGVFGPQTDSDVELGADGVAFKKLFVDDIDLNGQGRIDLDADADTSIRSSADDVIKLEAGGTDIITVTASGMAVGSGAGSGGLSLGGDGTGTFDGGLVVGASGTGAGFRAFGAATGEEMIWTAAENNLSFKYHDGSAQATIMRLGGDANTDYAIDVTEGSNNINKIRAGAFVTYSDESLKQDIQTMNTALDTVMSLNGVEFTWKDSGERDFGFIAQDVQKVVPKAVHTASDGVQGVDYSRLTSVLVEAVKAQQVQIEELKALLKK